MTDFRTGTVSVGLDVHAASIRLAAVRADELLDERTLPYDPEAVGRVIARWPGARVCYEAGPTGFGLYRHLTAAGIACEVVAPGLVPLRPGDRVKTDPRDARKLARLHAGGLLESICVPSVELEAVRDLVRAREAARLDRMRDRHRLSKFVLRHGRRMPFKSWGAGRRKWLGEQSFDQPAQQLAFDSYLQALDLVDRRVEALDCRLADVAEQGEWAGLVARLRCLRGIDTLTAVGLAAEIGDFARFESAEAFMSFVGLVPSERSSGEKRRQRSITKGRQRPRAPVAGRGGLASAPPPAGRLRARPPPARSAPRRDRACLALPAAPAPPLPADGRPRQAPPEDRRGLRPRAGRVRLGDRHRPAAQARRLSQHRRTSRSRAADESNHTENPRNYYAALAPAGNPRL
jgi:transposase